MDTRKIVLLTLCCFPFLLFAQQGEERPYEKSKGHRSFNRALANGNNRKASAIVKRKLYRYDRRMLFSGSFDKSGNAVKKTIQWLKRQPNVKQIVADTCGIHICIWPGWVDYGIVAQSNTGLVEYAFTVQQGRANRLSYWAGNWWRHRAKFLYFKPVEGRIDAFANNCKLEDENQRRMLNDNKLRFSVDPGRLNWSVFDAPKLEDSDKNTLRFKLEFENLSYDTLRLAYPLNQNAGEKIIYVRFHDAMKPQRFIETRNIELLLDGNTKGPDTLVLAPGQRHSEWHSFNDELHGDRDLRALHRIDSLPNGSYRAEIIYNPPKRIANDSTLWRPSCDSISAWLQYMWKYSAPEELQPLSIWGEVMDGPSEYQTSYGMKGKYIGLVKVISTSDSTRILPGETIAWKYKASHFKHAIGRPVALEPFQTKGNRVKLELDGNLATEILDGSKLRLFGIAEGANSLELLKEDFQNDKKE